MKRIEMTQSGKGMKNGLILLGESENFVMLYSVRKIVSAYVDHTLIIQRSGKKDWYKIKIIIQLRFSKAPITSKYYKLTKKCL